MAMKIATEVSLEEVKERASRNTLLRYGVNTCWWGMDDAPWYMHRAAGLPCDPRSGMLFQTEDSMAFIRNAEENAEHYGKYGLRTFLLALHGCVVTAEGLPTCFSSWKEYEELIDAKPKDAE